MDFISFTFISRRHIFYKRLYDKMQLKTEKKQQQWHSAECRSQQKHKNPLKLKELNGSGRKQYGLEVKALLEINWDTAVTVVG